MKLFYLLLILGVTTVSYAQEATLKEQVQESYTHYEEALKEIKLAITKLEDCDKTHSIDLINRNASAANSYLSRAERMIGYAREKASDAGKEASELNCSTAEEHTSDAEGYFYDAERKLDSAVRNLPGSGSGKDLNLHKQSIADAEADINRALKKMNDAVEKLGATLVSFEDCIKN